MKDDTADCTKGSDIEHGHGHDNLAGLYPQLFRLEEGAEHLVSRSCPAHLVLIKMTVRELDFIDELNNVSSY